MTILASSNVKSVTDVMDEIRAILSWKFDGSAQQMLEEIWRRSHLRSTRTFARTEEPSDSVVILNQCFRRLQAAMEGAK